MSTATLRYYEVDLKECVYCQMVYVVNIAPRSVPTRLQPIYWGNWCTSIIHL